MKIDQRWCQYLVMTMSSCVLNTSFSQLLLEEYDWELKRLTRNQSISWRCLPLYVKLTAPMGKHSLHHRSKGTHDHRTTLLKVELFLQVSRALPSTPTWIGPTIVKWSSFSGSEWCRKKKNAPTARKVTAVIFQTFLHNVCVNCHVNRDNKRCSLHFRKLTLLQIWSNYWQLCISYRFHLSQACPQDVPFLPPHLPSPSPPVEEETKMKQEQRPVSAKKKSCAALMTAILKIQEGCTGSLSKSMMRVPADIHCLRPSTSWDMALDISRFLWTTESLSIKSQAECKSYFWRFGLMR